MKVNCSFFFCFHLKGDMSSGVSFKIFCGEQARRFRLDKVPNWLSFLYFLDEQIFKEDEYHPELNLEYIGEQTHVISSAEDWDTMIESVPHEPIIKLKVIEGNSRFYFKDSPPPIPLYFYREEFTTFYTQIQYEGEDRWCPFSQLEVGQNHLQLGENVISHKVDSEKSVSWSFEDNSTEGNIEFDIHSEPFTFTGFLKISENESVHFKGIALPQEKLSPQQLDLPDKVSSALSLFFPKGKILPHHTPSTLSDVITITESGNDVDVDVNIEKLYQAVHNEGLRLLEQTNYEEARKFLMAALDLKPQSPVIHYNVACMYSLMNDVEKGMVELQIAVAQGYSDVVQLTTDEDLVNLQSCATFWGLVEEMNVKNHKN